MRYTKISTAKPFEGTPHINLPDAVGASPKKPILIRIAATGKRPLSFLAQLPDGLKLEGGIITGSIDKEGEYPLTVTAENEEGSDTKSIVLKIKKDQVQLTPLLGFTSWNAFAFEVNRDMMEYAADKMLKSGICEYGYNFINIDSGWQGEYGGKYDAIMPNEKFPDMKGFCDKMHSLGLKCGIYSTPMLHAFGCSIDRIPLPPGCTQGEADDRFADERGGIGVIRKEKNNALQWAEWGFDYLKYDWRPSDPINAELMRRELVDTNRDFVFCVTVKARPEYHKYWEKYCNSYRCNPDSIGTWDNLLTVYRTYFDFIDYINQGHYFDLDMLEIGKSDLFEFFGFYNDPNYGLTEDEQIAAFTMRAFMSSPIQISTNFKSFGEFELSVFCNEEILAINQDIAANAAIPCLIEEQGNKIIHAFKKMLSNDDIAYCIFNLGKTEETVKLYLDGNSSVRDLWAKEDMKPTKMLTIQMMPHTVRVFRTKIKE